MAAQRKAPKVRMVCEKCRSEEVTRDAWAEWGADEQKWVLGTVYDHTFCHNCQERTHIKQIRIRRRRSGTKAPDVIT
jgi:type II secretory ATPase GspE/PulE/Tfp pilus assembly ATPase PilB-like protein